MWSYEKRLQYPVKISQTNPELAQVIISQFGGPDGELSASMRYLAQRYTMPYNEVTGILTDIGREAPEMFRGRRQSAKPIFIAATDLPLTDGRGALSLQGPTFFFALCAGNLPVDTFP